MRDLIRRILREDDFQWLRDIPSEELIDLSTTWVIKNDLWEKDPSMFAVQEKLFDLGFEWGPNGKTLYKVDDMYEKMLGICVSHPESRILSYWGDDIDSTSHLELYINESKYHEVYNASEFLKSKNIEV